MKLDASDLDDLRPLIDAAVRATIEQVQAEQAKLGDRLGFDEATAAEAIGVPKHVLRDARLGREIHGRKVGKKIVYTRSALVTFLGETHGD